MRVTANMSADSSLYNIQQGRARLDKLQELISSGQNVNRPSDDPISSNLLLDIGDKLKAFDQYNSNITKSTSWLQFNNTALNGMFDVMTQTKSLVSSLYDGSASPSDRQLAHDQLVELKKQLVDMANTKFGDQYLFSGANSTVPPFNTTNTTYAGDSTQRQIEIAQGTTQAISITGDRLLKGGGASPNYGSTDILQQFDNMIAAVGDSTTPSNVPAIRLAAQGLDDGKQQIYNAVNDNLSRLVRLDNMKKLNENNVNTLNAVVGNIQNVDYAKLGIQLNSEKTAFEASLSATAKISQLSLLDFL